MKQVITWEKTKGDTVNGFGITIHYSYTSFNPDEIDKLKRWCTEHLKSGVIVEGQMQDCDLPVGAAQEDARRE